MAQEISKLFVTLGLEDKGFKSQLKQIDKQMSAMGKTMMVAGAAILAGIGMAVKAWAAAGDEVQKMSLRTNWAAESLSELRYVAEISGTELGAFEKSSRKMTQSITQASDGLATYIREFDRLGLNAKELKEMKSEEAFWVIAEALAGMENEIEMSNTALAIFGRNGTALLPMLAEGAEGISKLRQEAHDTGAVFDQEAAEAAAHFSDTIKQLEYSIKGVTFAIAEQAAPTIESYAAIITDAVQATSKFADEHTELSNILVTTGISFGEASLAVGGLILILPKLISLATSLKLSFWKLSAAIAGITVGFTLMATGINMLLQETQRYNAQLETARILSEEYAKAKRGETNTVYESIAAHADALEVLAKASHMNREAKEEQYEYIRYLRQVVKDHQDYEKAVADTNARLEEQRVILQADADKFVGMIKNIRYAYSESAKFGVTIEDIVQYMVEAGRGAELLGIKWHEIGEDADLLARKLNLSRAEFEKLAGGDLLAQAYQTYEKEIQALDDIADADKRAIDSRLDYYREKVYERTRLIEEAALKEIAAVNPSVAAILEGYNEEMEGLDEREKARDIARENERIANLEAQLEKEELSEAERKRIERDLEEAEDAQRERKILERRNAEIAALPMEEYLEDKKTAIEQNLEDEKALKETALEETKNNYKAELADFIDMWNAKVEKTKYYTDLINKINKAYVEQRQQQLEIYLPEYKTFEPRAWYEAFGFGKNWRIVEKSSTPEFASGGIVPGIPGQPVPVIAHGGEIISRPGQASQNITNQFHIAQLVVREEADVQKVARQLYRMQQVRI